jgi:hypothetical protein
MSTPIAIGLDGVVPGLDYTTVDCLEHRRLLAFVNHFLIRSVESLTTFSSACNTKLASISSRIKKLENAVSLLEAKLESVPELSLISIENVSISEASTSSFSIEVSHFYLHE